MTAGGVASTTVRVVVHVALLPAASVAVTVIVCVPGPTSVSDAGDCVIVRAPDAPQLSEAVALEVTSGTAASHPAPVCAVDPAGQLIVGGCVSRIVTVKEHDAVLPLESVAVQVTVVTPTGNTAPEGGEQSDVVPGQLSVIVGSAKLTVVEQAFEDAG